MRRFALGWKKLGHEKRLKVYIVNYADDLVIRCRAKAVEASDTMRDMMTRLKLTVNETKTRVCKVPEETFEPHRKWLIGSAFQLLRQFVQPTLYSVLLDVLERLIVHSCCSAIGFAARVGECQKVLAIHLVVQGYRSESWAIPSLCRANKTPQGPQFRGCKNYVHTMARPNGGRCI